jgi:hypothetical protein
MKAKKNDFGSDVHNFAVNKDPTCYHLILRERDNKLAAYVNFITFGQDVGAVTKNIGVSYIWCRTDLTSAGIATFLYEIIEIIAKMMEVNYIKCFAAIDFPALRFWKSKGFTHVSDEKTLTNMTKPLDRWDGVVSMKKKIKK